MQMAVIHCNGVLSDISALILTVYTRAAVDSGPRGLSDMNERDHVDGRVRVRHLPGEEMAAGCTMGRRQAGGGSVMLNVLLGNLGSWHSCGCYFDTYQLPKDCCRPRTPLHGNNIP
ncbi:uncharacterized protein LOC127417191 isoform X1 [Myxocyprinus asiaticus]|uniref:uncharacterized protein LOC127417191 isoform X1 n=1 Tax=Myxocyprinus asiaticus TaxID=70543 RepID=UPI002222C29F|nr:uncharacterized protein LOC127417191 isoform X1 [Myxocyprinus asiaticus]